MPWPDGFAQTTKRIYRNAMQAFRLFMHSRSGQTGKDLAPESLVKCRIEDLQNRTFEFEQLVVDYFIWLKTTYVSRVKRVTVIRRHPKKRAHPITTYYPGGNKPSDKTRKNYVDAIRSFFASHRLDLKFTTQQKRIISKRPKAVFRDYLFDLEDIATMAEFANPQERYILLVGKDVGLRAVDFASFTQGLFANVLTKEPPVFLGKVYTQKEGVYAFPFLTSDGVEAARVWLQTLKSKGLQDDKALMLSIRSKELAPNLKRLAAKAGINPHGQRIRFHCLRKFLIDRISLTMSESKWKQIVGRRISEEAYVSPLKLREAYMHIMPHVQVSAIRETGLTQVEIMKLKRILNMVKKKELVFQTKKNY